MGIATGSLVSLAFRVGDILMWGLIGVLTARTLSVEDRGVYATAIWWFFGAATSTYADLRADVDGTEEDEIYLEEEEEDFEALAKGAPTPGSTTPGTPGSTGTPAAPATPATGTPPPPSTTPPATPPAV